MTTPPTSGIWPPSTTAKPRRRWVVPTLAALVVALVGVLAAVLLRPGTETETPAEVAQTSEAPETGTVGQYAGLVNAVAVDFRETSAKYDDNSCGTVDDSSVTCALYALTLDVEARTLVLSLTGAQKPGVPAYIGPPPAEIERLVEETIEAAQALDDAYNGPDDAFSAEFRFAISSVARTLDRWEPYL